MTKHKIIRKLKKLLWKIIYCYVTLLLTLKITGALQSTINYKSIKHYKEIVRDFSEFLDLESIESPVEIFEYFNYALWNGYLSYNHTASYDVTREVYMKDSGVGVINGEIICLNNADFLTKLFKESGFDAYSVNCYVEDASVENIRTNKLIDRNISTDSNLVSSIAECLSKIGLIIGNHSITAVNYEGNIYYFDPTNLLYLGKNNLNNIYIINGEGDFKIKYVFGTLYADLEGYKDIFSKTSESYDYDYLVNLEEIEIDETALEQFYQEHKSIYEEVFNESDGKPQILIIIICSILTSIALIPLKNLMTDRIIDYKGNKKTELFIKLHRFFTDHEVYNIKNVTKYISFMLDNGYLSIDKKNNKYKIKVHKDAIKSAKYQDYKIDFILEYVKSRGYKTKLAKITDDLGHERKIVIMYDYSDRYCCYDIENNEFIDNKDNEFMIDEVKYRIKSKRVSKFIISLDKPNDYNKYVSYNTELCSEFKESNYSLIRAISNY